MISLYSVSAAGHRLYVGIMDDILKVPELGKLQWCEINENFHENLSINVKALTFII
jgi:hypothetical protein